MKITSVKEVFNDHIEDMRYIIESTLGKTMVRSIDNILNLRKINKIKKYYDYWPKGRTHK